MDKNKIRKALEQDPAGAKLKQDFAVTQNHYLLELYKWLRTYENIFSGLLAKKNRQMK